MNRNLPAALLALTFTLAACNQANTPPSTEQSPAVQRPGTDNGQQPGASSPTPPVTDGGAQNPPPSGQQPNRGPAGTLDSSFGSGGIARVASGGIDDLAIQPSGKIVALIAEGFTGPDVYRKYLARFNPDGSRDASFGNAGQAPVAVKGDRDELALQAGGAIIVGGGTAPIVRFTPDGQQDPSFGNGGTIPPDGDTYHVAVQPDGKVLVLSVRPNPPSSVVLRRFTPDGQPDSSFGSGGRVTLSNPQTDASGETRWSYPYAEVEVGPGGKIFVGGHCSVAEARFNYYPNGAFCVTRLESNGQLDTSYGNLPGLAAYETGKYHEARSMAVMADGRVVLAGAVNFYGSEWRVIRVSSDGKSHQQFSSTYLSVGTPTTVLSEVLVDENGRTIVTGSYNRGGNDAEYGARFVVVRFNPDGALDDGFGGGGKLDVLPSITRAHAYSAAFTGDGAMVVGGVIVKEGESTASTAVLAKVWR